MRVVPVNAPRRQNPFRKSVFTRTPDVIHDFALPIFDDRLAYPRSEIVKHRVPTNALPLSFAAFANALQRIKNPIRIGNLIKRGWPFRTVAPARSWILRITFKLLNLVRLFIDIGE